MSQSPEFPGWDTPQQNWSKLPHELVALIPKMKESELKITLYILRHTWGFGNFTEYQCMTTDEIMSGRWTKSGDRIDGGTGLSKQSVITGIKAGITRGTLEEFSERMDKARIRKGYRLRGKQQDQGSKILTPAVQNLDIEHNKETPIDKKTTRPKAGKAVNRARFNADMEKAFSEATNLPLPKRITKQDRRSAGKRWNNPLWNMYDLFRPEEERQGEADRQYDEDSLSNTITLIGHAVMQMKADNLTIDAPASIEKVATSIYARQFANLAKVNGDGGFWDQYK